MQTQTQTINLTNREVEFLVLYAIGFKSVQIGKLWFREGTTTKTHMQNIRTKMHVPSINAAVSLAHQLRIINIDEFPIARTTPK